MTGERDPTGFVALGRFEVRPGWEDPVADAFQSQPRRVAAHADMPLALRLVPSSAQLIPLEHVTS